jgi:hypothetical protein
VSASPPHTQHVVTGVNIALATAARSGSTVT